MDKRVFAAVLGLIFSVIFAGTAELFDNCRQLEENVLRLHILADSDSYTDQQLKLMVRDSLLEHSEEIFGGSAERDDIIECASRNMDRICEIAEETLSENGSDCTVKAELAEMSFDRRVYGNIVMPEGDYTALRVTIGSGSGHNWWCVMFPPLCIPCFTDEMTDEEMLEKYGDIITDDEAELLMDHGSYEIKFYFRELWLKIKDKYKG